MLKLPSISVYRTISGQGSPTRAGAGGDDGRPPITMRRSDRVRAPRIGRNGRNVACQGGQRRADLPLRAGSITRRGRLQPAGGGLARGVWGSTPRERGYKVMKRCWISYIWG